MSYDLQNIFEMYVRSAHDIQWYDQKKKGMEKDL